MQLQSFLFDGDDHYTKIGALDNRTRQASQTHECVHLQTSQGTHAAHHHVRQVYALRPHLHQAVAQSEPLETGASEAQAGQTKSGLDTASSSIHYPGARSASLPKLEGPRCRHGDEAYSFSDEELGEHLFQAFVIGLYLTEHTLQRRAQARKKKATQNQGKQAKSDQKPRDTKQVSKKAKEKDDTEADDRPAASKKSHHEREASVAHQAHEDKAQKLKPAKPQEQKNQQKDLPKTMVKAPATDSDDTPINSGYFSVLTMTSGQLKALKYCALNRDHSLTTTNVVNPQVH